MKKKFIATVMSLSMIFSIFSSSIPVVQAKENTDDIDYSSYQTGRLEESEEGQEWLNDNMLNIESKEQVDQIIDTRSDEMQLYSANPYSEIEGEIPSSVDNSNTKYFPPIVNQIGGACASYSLVYYMMTYYYNKSHNTSANCDENIMSPRWTYNLTNNGGDNGSFPSACVRRLICNGVAPISDVPIKDSKNLPENYYTDYFARDDIWEHAQNNRIKDGYYLKVGDSSQNTPITSPKDEDLNLIKYALSKGEIFSFATDIYTFRYRLISENDQVPENKKHAGEFIVGRCDYSSGGPHEMTIVGYDDDIWYDINENGKVDEGEKGAFKVANSWGVSYKNSGYVWLSYDALNKVSSVNNENISGKERYPAIDNNQVIGLIMEDKSEKENFYLEVVANTADKSKIYMDISDANNSVGNILLSPVFTEKKGNSYGFDGTKEASDGKFLFDLSRYNKELTKDKILKDGVKITVGDTAVDDNNLIIKSLTLVDKNNNTRTELLKKEITLNGNSAEINSKDSGVESPYNLSAKVNNGNISLNWSVRDNKSIAYYQIFRNDLNIGQTTDTNFVDDSDVNGQYSYAVRSVDSSGNVSQKVYIDVNNTYCKVYYKNSNYASSYINYKINSDSWTIEPGIKMNSSSDKQGYSEYIIDLSKSSVNSEITACFNNGNSLLDNNGGKNYKFTKGTFVIENGTIKKENAPLKVLGINFDSKSPQTIGRTIKLNPVVTGGSGDYRCYLNIEKDGYSLTDFPEKVYYWTPEEVGDYTFTCEVEDKVTGERVAYTDEINFNIRNEEQFDITGLEFDEKSPQLLNSDISFYIKTNADDLNNDISYEVTVINPEGYESTLYSKLSEKNRFKYTSTDKCGTYTIVVKATNKSTNENMVRKFNYYIEKGDLKIKSFAAKNSIDNDENLDEVKASDYYCLVPYAIGGSGNYSYEYGYYFDNKYTKIDNNYCSFLSPNIEKPGKYKFEVVVKDKEGNSAKAYKDLTITPGDLLLESPKVDKSTIKINDVVNCTFKSKYNVDKVKYKVTDMYNGSEEVLQDFTYGDTFKYKATIGGYHVLFVEGKDSRGVVSSSFVSIYVNPDPNQIVIDMFKAKNDTIEIGQSFDFEIKLSGGYGDKKYDLVAINEDNERIYISNKSNEKEVKWTPNKVGKYKIQINCYDDANSNKSSTIDVTVTKPKKLATTTIYYSGYDNPYIHYRVGNGQWTVAPGVKMEKSDDVSGYPYKMTIDLNDADNMTACFNNGNGQWDSNNGRNYNFKSGYYTYSNGVITKIEKPTKKLEISSFTSNVGDKMTAGNQAIFKAEVKNATGNVQYRYSYKNNTTGESGIIKNYSQYSDLSWMIGTEGNYTITVEAKDDQTVTSKSLNITIVPYEYLKIQSVTSSLGDTFKEGNETNLTINTTGGNGSNYYSITVNGESILNSSSTNSVNWKPEKAGTYKIVASAREVYGGSSDSYEKTITVTEKSKNVTTIYYKGYENPYIHYNIGGKWTAAPGIKMTPCTDVEGYNYKVEIDLDEATSLTACFNNGHGQWDSNNGKNYTFNVGYYTFSNGKITKIEKPEKKLEISSFTSSVGDKIVSGNQAIFKAQVKNATGNVQYRYSYKNNTTGESGVIRNYSQDSDLSWMMGIEGNYTMTVEAKDDQTVTSKSLNITIVPYEYLKIQSVVSSLGDTFKEGNETILTINTIGGKGSNYYSITVNGESILNSSSSNSVNWKPEKAGNYKIVASAREVYGGSSDSYEKTITVTEKSKNSITIYYKGYDTPYMHYKIGNGAWTSAPGIRMEATNEKPGYTHKLTIDLGDSKDLTACFNNGHGSWDSRNGANYYFQEAGTYTYSNGSINKIN